MEDVEITTTNDNSFEQDYMYNYHSAKLTFRLNLLEFNVMQSKKGMRTG